MLELILLACACSSPFGPRDFCRVEQPAERAPLGLADAGLIAFGMTMVIMAGEIDLSVGSAVAFSGCLLAWMVQAGVPTGLAMVVTLVAGLGSGAFVGLMRAKFEVPSFITTLALMTGLRGAALLITGGSR